ncbi:MAG: right-handed parallel beta-helix repeat-containing protein, partial [Pseudomonadota bacterium]|nr:right-handed parallel beta-helix repeat-containing protein [Pseudomonadota bacterium]
MRPIVPIVAAAVALTLPAAAQERAPFTIAETGQGFATIDEAVQSVRMGKATILIAPGTYHQCTVQAGGDITFKAVQAGTAIFEGTTCEGKAAFVLRGQRSAVDGLVFRGMRVGDGNGAGVRTEMGDLTVTHSMFLDSQEGILGGQPTDQHITIDHSTFSGLGTCEAAADCAHAIYLANKGSVSITNSRFERGTGGHYVKLRVPHVMIADNSFDDTGGRKTNYMIDLPEGA